MGGPSIDLEELLHEIAAARSGELKAVLERIPSDAVAGLEHSVRERLDTLPAPLGPRAQGPWSTERQALEGALGCLEARRGEPERLLRLARERWLRGGSHADYLRLLLSFGQRRRAIGMAMTLLDHDACEARTELEGFLTEGVRLPEGWYDAVAALAEDPSEAKFRALQRFTPPEDYEGRTRWTLRLLHRLGVPPDRLFPLATLEGTTPEAMQWAEKGQVEPRIIEERAARAPATARPLWLGLAARSACMRGDRLGVVRLLRKAYDEAEPSTRPDSDLEFVKSHGDPELLTLLVHAGLPPKGGD